MCLGSNLTFDNQGLYAFVFHHVNDRKQLVRDAAMVDAGTGKDGAVVRALASHQGGPGSIPGYLGCCIGSCPCPEGSFTSK